MVMRCSNSTLLPLDLEIKGSATTLLKAKIDVLLVEQQHKEEVEMEDQPHQTFGDYCRCTDADQISPGFQPTNPVTFDI